MFEKSGEGRRRITVLNDSFMTGTKLSALRVSFEPRAILVALIVFKDVSNPGLNCRPS